MLAIMGLLLVGSLAGESLAKGIFAGALGVWLSMVGMDTFTGQGRFTFGSIGLMSGIHFVAIMIGLFGVSEALVQIHDIHIQPMKQDVRNIIPSWRLLFKHLPLIIKSSLIGIGIGALTRCRRRHRGPDVLRERPPEHQESDSALRQGAYEGVIAPETANNACIGGDNIPMITLGIPGDAVTAILIGALYIHGLKPGPMLMIDTPHLFWFWVGALTLANTFLLPWGSAESSSLPRSSRCARAAPADHHHHLRRRHLRHPEQPLRRLLDAGVRDLRIYPQDVWVPDGAGHSRRDPRADHGGGIPADDAGVQNSAPMFLWSFISHPLTLVLIAITIAHARQPV